MFNDTPDRLLGVRRHMVFRQTSAVITVNIRSVYDDADDPDDVFMCVCVCVCNKTSFYPSMPKSSLI